MRFELGDYEGASTLARTVTTPSQHAAACLETEGLALLFAARFDEAAAAFSALGTLQPIRGRVWLGMLHAWTGSDASAEENLRAVVAERPEGAEAANARFYLAQLALWQGRNDEAAHTARELIAVAPGYLSDLLGRALNWHARGVHLIRAYFTLAALAKLAELTGWQQFAPIDVQAAAALDRLEANPGAFATHVVRLRAARLADLAERQRLLALVEAERLAFLARTRDTDGDDIPDVRDRCPTERETHNAFEDDDGCPEATAAIEVIGNQIRIRAGYSIYFAHDDANVLPRSEPVLAQIAAVLTSPDYAWIRRIRLDGHTDDVGETDYNDRLSFRRIQSVGAALVARGARRVHIDYRALGERRPVDFSGTDAGRARNRRVEILITDPPIFGGVRM
ncbi:MAG: OmpA family protein [Deltaproteobacteria bacterium]|nr:OmpA family protein [Deltaproteobacteria bacterium]